MGGYKRTLFSVGVGLGHFMQTIPTFGKVGGTVSILGNNPDRRHQCDVQRNFSNLLRALQDANLCVGNSTGTLG